MPWLSRWQNASLFLPKVTGRVTGRFKSIVEATGNAHSQQTAQGADIVGLRDTGKEVMQGEAASLPHPFAQSGPYQGRGMCCDLTTDHEGQSLPDWHSSSFASEALGPDERVSALCFCRITVTEERRVS